MPVIHTHRLDLASSNNLCNMVEGTYKIDTSCSDKHRTYGHSFLTKGFVVWLHQTSVGYSESESSMRMASVEAAPPMESLWGFNPACVYWYRCLEFVPPIDPVLNDDNGCFSFRGLSSTITITATSARDGASACNAASSVHAVCHMYIPHRGRSFVIYRRGTVLKVHIVQSETDTPSTPYANSVTHVVVQSPISLYERVVLSKA